MKSNFYFRIIIPALLFLVCGKLNAQHPSPPWAWAKAIYGTNYLESPYPGPAVAVDTSSGAVYTTGSFLGTLDFDPGEGIFNLDSLSIYGDMFISKLDGNGNFVWAKQFSSPAFDGSCFGYSIAVDPTESGDIYTTGSFFGAVDFDPGPEAFILNYSGAQWGNSDIFISRLDSSGNFKWAKKMGGTGDAYGRSVSIDPSGEGAVYILGTFNGTIDFNPGDDSFMITSVGEHDFFVTKLDLSGNFLWTKSFGGPKEDFGFAMALDPKYGDVYVTGDFSGQVDFNPGDSSYILTSGPYFDIFILKLDREGNFVWVKPMFGTESSKGGAGYAIAIDYSKSGDVYTTGYFEGKVDFDPDDKGFYFLNSTGKNDVFISKLNSSGSFVWAKAMGGINDDKGNAIVFDPVDEGGVYIMGDFTNTVDLDPDPADTFQLTAVHGNDIFISKLNVTGDFEWAKPLFANNANQNPTLAFDGQFLYTAGIASNTTISFDSIIIPNSSDLGFRWNVFIAKLNTISFATSVAEINNHQINIYPNPATTELTIEIEGDHFRDASIIIYNILSEVVYSRLNENISNQKTIDISILNPGIYLMEANIDRERVMKKFVKM